MRDGGLLVGSEADWRDKRVTVMGLGRFGGGVAVARWLAGRGARVRAMVECEGSR